MISADVLEIGREARKFFVKAERPTPFNLEDTMAVERKDGRVNFVSQDREGNLIIGNGCETKIDEYRGTPFLFCEHNKFVRREEINFEKSKKFLKRRINIY